MRTVLNLLLTALAAGAALLITGIIVAGLANPAAGLLIGLLAAVSGALFTWRRLSHRDRGPSPRNPRLVAAGLLTLIVLFGCGILANLAPAEQNDAAPKTAPAPTVASAVTRVASSNAAANTRLVTIDDTPVQAAPHAAAAALNTLPVGHQPDIVGILADDPSWYQLSSGGWIHASHLRGEPPAAMQLLDTPPTDAPSPTAPSPTPVPATATPFYTVPDDVYATATVAQEAAIRAAQQEAIAGNRGLWAAGATGPIVTRAADLHQGPGAGYPVVGNLTAGTQLDLFGINSAGDWLQLAGGLWIAASLVADIPVGLPVTATDAFLPRGNPTPVPARAPAYTGSTRAERGIEFRSTCVCDQGNIYNCPDFDNGMDARACYLKCLDETGRDVHDLDGDKDGDACEKYD